MSLADKGSITYYNGEKYAVSVASVKEMLVRTLVQAVLLFVFQSKKPTKHNETQITTQKTTKRY